MPFFHPKKEEYKQSLLRDIPKEDCQINETSKHFIQWISFQHFLFRDSPYKNNKYKSNSLLIILRNSTNEINLEFFNIVFS